jgi:dimethylargininase
MFTYAIVRTPGTNFARGITTANLGMPDYPQMVQQHQAYTQTLMSMGLEVIVLDAEPRFPDAYFVEDVAVVTPQVAIITNPGAQARKGEEDSLVGVLARYRPIARILPPGTLDGGDVLIIGSQIFIGISARTNLQGASQMGQILAGYGYHWTPVPIAAGLHLKSSVNHIGKSTLLICEDFAKRDEFVDYLKIIVPKNEEYAANTLWINDHLIMPYGFPQTKQRLVATGLPVVELDVSEARKMDGGLTCMSLRF